MDAKELAKQVEQNTGRKVVYCARVGSYNYGLNNQHSDKDYKAFVLPTFEDLYKGKIFSSSHVSDDVDYTVHDIRKLAQFLWKSNINFLEVLFTDDYYIGAEEFEFFLHNREDIVKMNIPYLYNACNGMYYNKIKRLHNYSDANQFMKENFGYNTKEACHATRIMKVVIDIVEHNLKFFNAINYASRPLLQGLLLGIKDGEYSEKSWEKLTKPIRDEFTSQEFIDKVNAYTPNEKLKEKLDAIVHDLVKKELEGDKDS